MRKKGVGSGINRQVLVWDHGAGHLYVSGFSCGLLICIFPFPLSPRKKLGSF